MRYCFSGHESFPCKSMWLKKGYDYLVDRNRFTDPDAVVVSVSAILSCRPFFILIFLLCIKMKHYGFSRKSIWKNLETFP